MMYRRLDERQSLQEVLGYYVDDIVEKIVERTARRTAEVVMKRMKEELKAEPSRQYTRAEVKALLHVSYVTLNKWEKSGKLVPVRVGCRVLYDEDKINGLLQSQKSLKVVV